MDRFRIITVLNSTGLSLTLNEATVIADALHREIKRPTRTRLGRNLSTLEGRVAYARTLPAVMQHVPDRKIQAIKELRTHLQSIPDGVKWSGLKECKDVIDLLCPSRFY